MVVNVNQIKGKKVFWYEEPLTRNFIIDVHGLGEFKIDRWDMVRAADYFRIHNGRNWTNEEGIQWAIKYAQKESEYIDFEEVPIKLVSTTNP